MQAIYSLLFLLSFVSALKRNYVYVEANWATQLTLQLCQVTVLLVVELLIFVQCILVVYFIGTYAIAASSTATIFAQKIRLQDSLLRRLPVHIMQLCTAT